MQDDTTIEKSEQEDSKKAVDKVTAASKEDAAAASDTSEQKTEPAAEQTPETQITHCYYEVGNDLLSKPNALCDIIQAEGYPTTVVFCNSPSEADMVEVMLKKKSISCCKLIGHVPFTKVSQALHQVSEKQLTTLIVTDIAARDLDPGIFGMIVNYSIHDDPEIYIHRMTGHGKESQIKKALCLISPLDFGNFHYLKKVVDFEFKKAELPSEDKIFEGEAQRLLVEAKNSNFLEDSRIKHFTSLIAKSPDLESIVAFLLNNTLNVIPKLQSSGRERGEGRDSDGAGGRGRDRDRRRDGRDFDRRGPQDRRRDDEDRYSGRGRRGDDSRGARGGSRGRPESKDLPPPKKDVRVYIGHGVKDDLTEQTFAGLMQQCCNLAEDQIKRLTIRDSYSFVDLPEEIADDALDSLQGATLENGTELFFRKATTISVPRDAVKPEETKQSETDQDAGEKPVASATPKPEAEEEAASKTDLPQEEKEESEAASEKKADK